MCWVSVLIEHGRYLQLPSPSRKRQSSRSALDGAYLSWSLLCEAKLHRELWLPYCTVKGNCPQHLVYASGTTFEETAPEGEIHACNHAQTRVQAG